MRSIQEYYKHSIGSATGNLRRRGDKYLASVDIAPLVEFYHSMYKLPKISLVDGEEPQVIPDDPSSVHNSTDSIKATIRFDVEKEEKTELVLKLETINPLESERIIACDENGFFIRTNLSPQNVKKTVEEYTRLITELVSRKNAEIENMNQKLREELTKIQSNIIDQISEIIPLTKKANPSSPVVPLVKKKQVIINPPRPRVSTYPKIDQKILDSIIDILMKGGLTFEAAPETFLKLGEQDLRNILISFLNGNFQLFASAEAFNKLGKTDISLRYSGDNLFVAECKFWGGEGPYKDTIDQLFRYLTWRENIGVLVIFARQKDFSSVIEKAKEATTLHGTFALGSLKDKTNSYFISRHHFPEDNQKIVEIHHLLFTIYSPRESQ